MSIKITVKEESNVQKRNDKYADYVSKISPYKNPVPSLLRAFLVGGVICIIGELIYMMWLWAFPAYTIEYVSSLTSATLITIAAVLTGFGIYDKIGSFAGGGSVVPITGFSNSMTSAAMEFRKEGVIFGTCANMFKIAGPVLVVGIALSMLVGGIYFIVGLF